ncbi:hypothetical protein BO71DRAFT_428393 [Aspergillus ellipticus CBS 707.79]|uniref:Zn(2)-C6 fungal-type domain-containing protein n=1 Tax=Aspergillus ellipticus CBS 707.79 TaxID=1448320 RepID=A0A319DXK2_9EURO|nr:hypothetical protein BO71DRAFT_428393 [Aspergillus ellipticus CBS 707.79]
MSGPEPACDECRIRKVRCDKAEPACSSCCKSGLVCQFTNKGRRVNHTKKLLEVAWRGSKKPSTGCLSAVEVSQTPSKSIQEPNIWIAVPVDPRIGPAISDDSLTDSLSDQGCERPNSIGSLYAEAQAVSDYLALSLPQSQDSSSERPINEGTSPQASVLRAQLTEAGALFQRLANGSPTPADPDPEPYDGLPPCLPPRALLEVFVETYFTELSPLLPIYDWSSVVAAMESECPVQRSPGNHSNFQHLLQPRLANVQALLSMALIALKYFDFTMFETVFAQACEIATSIGLHQSCAKQGPECRNLFWALFITDKHATLITGKPSLLPSYDCGIPLPISDPGIDQFTARISLAYIQEELHRSLYSAQVSRLDRNHLSRRARKLSRRLDDWTAQHTRILNPPATSSAQPSFCAAELHYALCICRVLVQRRVIAPQSGQLRLQHARTGMKVFRELCEGYQPRDGISAVAVFERFLLRYSTVLFIEIYIHALTSIGAKPPTNTEADPDTADLTFFASRADCLATRTMKSSYASTIRDVSVLCSDIITRVGYARQQQQQQQQQQSDVSAPVSEPPLASTPTFLEAITKSGTFSTFDPYWDLSTSSLEIETELELQAGGRNPLGGLGLIWETDLEVLMDGVVR